MGLNLIVFAWVLWYLNAPKWVWALFGIGAVMELLENYFRSREYKRWTI